MRNDPRPSESADEGFAELKAAGSFPGPFRVADVVQQYGSGVAAIEQWSEEMRAEFAFHLLLTCNTDRISAVMDRMAPLVKHDFVDELPYELAVRIFSHLDAASLARCARVSRKWALLAADGGLWQRLFERQGWALSARANAKTAVGPGGGTRSVRRALSSSSAGWQRMRAAEGSSANPPAGPSRTWKAVYRSRAELEANWRRGRYFVSALSGHAQTVYCVQSEDDVLVSGSQDCTVKLWSLAGRTPTLTLRAHEASVLCLQYGLVPTLGFPVVVSGASDASLLAWNARTGRPFLQFRGHGESVLGLRFNERVLVTCSKDRTICVWRAPNGWDMGHYDDAADEDDASEDETPWRRQRARTGDRALGEAAVGALAQSWGGQGRGQRFITRRGTRWASSPPPVDDWRELPAAQPLKVLVGHRAAVNAIALAGGRVASASGDRSLKLWDLATGQVLRTLLGHETGIACLHYDGRRIISGSSDKSIRLWDPESARNIATLNGHGGLVRTLAYDESAHRLVSGSYDETIRVWDTRMLPTSPSMGVADALDVLSISETPAAAESPSSVRYRPVLTLRVDQDAFVGPQGPPSPPQRSRRVAESAGASLEGSPTFMLDEDVPQQSSVVSNFRDEDGVPVVTRSTRLSFSSGSSTLDRPLPPFPAGLPAASWYPEPPPLPPRTPLGARSRSAATVDAPLPQPPPPPNRVLKIALDGGKIISCSQSRDILVWDFGRSVPDAQLFY